MTTASSIIADAYRESNLIPMGNSPTSNQQTEALGRLNTLLSSTIGNEAGDPLTDLNIGGVCDETWGTAYYVPGDVRLVLNMTAAMTLKLDPHPVEGQRLSIADSGNTLATFNLILDGNGRRIENAATLTLNTNGLTREWFYRADQGGWIRIATLGLSDALPFPVDFDDYFITMLAMRLNPRYGQSIAPETDEALKRTRSQLRARYNPPKPIHPEYMGRGLADQRRYYDQSNTTAFNTGRPYPWR